MSPTSGDLLLVNRGGVNYQIDYDDMSTLQDTDLLLVNRAGVNYQIAASDLDLGPDGLILPPVEVLTPVNGAGLNDGDAYTPISSAYVSTDTTPIYYRHFPLAITTVSGGTWTDENFIFDGNDGTKGMLSGATGEISQVVYTNHASFSRSGETDVHASAYPGGGTIEIIDENDTVLRTYTLGEAMGPTAVGIVRADNKIRLTSTNQDAYIWISAVDVGGADLVDYVISGRVAFEFTDSTDLDKMIAPIIQVDENGDVKVPTTSTVDSTTTIAGVNKSLTFDWTGANNTVTLQGNDGPADHLAPLGTRMVWAKANTGVSGIISDNVANYDHYLLTNTSSPSQAAYPPRLDENQSTYPPGGSYVNVEGVRNHIVEIGVAPKVLDIVTWTGDANSLREIPHNLGCKPGMIIARITNSSANWVVWHKDLGSGSKLILNASNGTTGDGDVFTQEPTQDAFYVGNGSETNALNDEYVAYVFAADTAGKVKCGTYTGRGYYSEYVDVGFPQGFVLIKSTNHSATWTASTPTTSALDKYWEPNVAGNLAGDSNNTVKCDNENSFILKGYGANYNENGRKYVYLAIAADLTGPNSTQLNLLNGQDLEYFPEGTEITSNLAANGSRVSFASKYVVGNDSTEALISPTVNGNPFFDIRPETANKWLIWAKCLTASHYHRMYDSERNYGQYLRPEDGTDPLYDVEGIQRPYQDVGYYMGDNAELNNGGDNYLYWNFLASRQFFDVVKYVGSSSSNHIIPHDLGVEPGLVIIKRLNIAENWWVYHADSHNAIPTQHYMHLNSGGGPNYLGYEWIQATDSNITFKTSRNEFNAAGYGYIAYIFAKDTPYVKCGTYTGTGTTNAVNTGFQSRWVMIKRIDDSGDWMILDKELAQSDKALKANTNGTQTTLGYAFDFEAFALTSSDPNVNANNGDYIYIAIADEVEGHPPNFPSSSTVQGTPDVNAATMVVNAESFDTGDSASAAALEASITAVGGSEGSSLLVDSSTGTWLPGLYAKGTETTVTAPSADEITFTSTNQGTTPFSNVDATLTSRTWTLESGPSATGPWTVVDTYVDYDALNSQDGATPWSSNKPTLAADTFYRVKVSYNSNNAESVESVFSTFKTSA